MPHATVPHNRRSHSTQASKLSQKRNKIVSKSIFQQFNSLIEEDYNVQFFDFLIKLNSFVGHRAIKTVLIICWVNQSYFSDYQPNG